MEALEAVSWTLSYSGFQPFVIPLATPTDENTIVFHFLPLCLLKREKERKHGTGWKEGEVERIWEKLGNGICDQNIFYCMKKKNYFLKERMKKKKKTKPAL